MQVTVDAKVSLKLLEMVEIAGAVPKHANNLSNEMSRDLTRPGMWHDHPASFPPPSHHQACTMQISTGWDSWTQEDRVDA
jgi:hypothetical protein